MLELPVPERELWDEKNEVFHHIGAHRLKLEHSLASISRWESKWQKPFLKSLPEMPFAELVDYVRCMTLSDDTPEDAYLGIGAEELRTILCYINDKRTATKVTSRSGRRGRARRETVTSELVYFWMIQYGIPFSPCENWHFNRLMTLVRVCQAKGGKPEKLGRQEAAEQRARLNAERRAKTHSRG